MCISTRRVKERNEERKGKRERICSAHCTSPYCPFGECKRMQKQHDLSHKIGRMKTHTFSFFFLPFSICSKGYVLSFQSKSRNYTIVFTIRDLFPFFISTKIILYDCAKLQEQKTFQKNQIRDTDRQNALVQIHPIDVRVNYEMRLVLHVYLILK